MVCWMIYKDLVKKMLKKYNVTDEQAIRIILDIESETGHNHNLIKAVIDYEGEGLIKRLRQKKKAEKKETNAAYV